MKNDTRSHVFNRHTALRISVPFTLLVFYVNQAWADVPPPPPAYHKQIDTSFPSGKALERMGYDPKTGVLKVDVNKSGNSKVTSNGGTVTGTQDVRITATDAYGNKATMKGKIIQSASTAVIVGHVAGAAVDGIGSYSEQVGSAIKQGNWGSAAHYSIMTGGAILDGMLGGAISKAATGFGRGIGTLPPDAPPSTGLPSPPFGSSYNNATPPAPSVNGSGTPSASAQSSALGKAAASAATAQAAAEKAGDIGGALGAAAVGKAAGAAAEAAKGNADYQQARERLEKGDEIWVLRKRIESKHPSGYGYLIQHSTLKYTDRRPVSTVGASVGYDGYGKMTVISGDSDLMSMLPRSAAKGVYSISLGWSKMDFSYKPDVNLKPSDMMLSQGDIAAILGKMFDSQQTNHAAMMSALSQIAANTAPQNPSTAQSGGQSSGQADSPHSQVVRSGPSIVDKATTGYSVSGDSAITAPYTPAGSDTPQQTQFNVNADGTVTATTIPRPDLKPHSSQAPTRHSIAPNTANTQSNSQDAPSVPNQNHGTQANTNQGQHGQQSGQHQQQNDRQDFCRSNPDSAVCMPSGNADYEDLSIPESTIDLSFQPADIFQTDGVCPQPKTVDLGIYGVHEFSYQPLCDFAAALRPVLISASIMMCAWFAYGALGES
ncbi:virulence factor TspB C-terminal domain-related protein [Neisseria dentiae]|uniref:virulence factor TspB C-terminal domain-related protein n=1 Tax=Neisseria dentiae TaxID=194197 RepID=UPI00359F9336